MPTNAPVNLKDLEGILKTKKFDTPYNQTLEFITESYANTPEIIPYEMVQYFQQYLKLHVGEAEKSEDMLKQELKKRLEV